MYSISQDIIFHAIDEVNEGAEKSSPIPKSLSTVLLGSDSSVDSLSLVRLLVTVERIAEERLGKSVVIVDESAFESEQSPFSTVNTLIIHLEGLISR